MSDPQSSSSPPEPRAQGETDDGLPVLAVPPTTRRQHLIKAGVTAVWLVFLGAPVRDLAYGGHSNGAVAAGSLALLAFLAGYVALVFRHTSRPFGSRRAVLTLLGGLFALAVVASTTLGDGWLVLFVYLAIASGAALPVRYAVGAIVVVVAALAGIGTDLGARPSGGGWTSFLVPAVLGGCTLMSARKTVRTLRELREARSAVARLAANEERLRLARDLHDLVGHSLSVITLKGELAGRMLPAHPEAAAAQVADIEQVSRQALVDVREAVSGYRRPTLAVELAGAQTALTAAGIVGELPAPEDRGAQLTPEREAALAWALREAVTNVVRHSDASRCTVTLAASGASGASEGSAPTLTLVVVDDGRGPTGLGDGAGDDTGEGHGLDGLRERLALVDGALETSAGARGGFTLRATVPSLP